MTNATINKDHVKFTDFEEAELFGAKKATQDDELKIEGNMWSHTQFSTYLNHLTKKQGSSTNYPNGIYQDKILPQLKKGVISSLLATRDSVLNDSKFVQHTLFGYDFMVDTNYNVWLIEVNSSPSMEYSSSITERMVKEGMGDIADIVTK